MSVTTPAAMTLQATWTQEYADLRREKDEGSRDVETVGRMEAYTDAFAAIRVFDTVEDVLVSLEGKADLLRAYQSPDSHTVALGKACLRALETFTAELRDIGNEAA